MIISEKDDTSNKNELHNYQNKLKQYQQKGSTKELIDKFIIINGAKYFSLGIFQNYSVFISANIVHTPLIGRGILIRGIL